MSVPTDEAALASSGLPFPVRVPFVEHLGMTLHAFGQGHAEIRVDLQPVLLNSFDVAHGGLLMTLLDVSMAYGARSADAGLGSASHDAGRGSVSNDAGRGVVTIEMKASFLQPAEGSLRAFASVLHRTPTMAFCEARVLNSRDALCAHATGTFKYVRALAPRLRGAPPPKETA